MVPVFQCGDARSGRFVVSEGLGRSSCVLIAGWKPMPLVGWALLPDCCTFGFAWTGRSAILYPTTRLEFLREVFSSIRPKGPFVCLAQANDLGIGVALNERANGPVICGTNGRSEQTTGPLALFRFAWLFHPGRWPGLGKTLGRWPEEGESNCGVCKGTPARPCASKTHSSRARVPNLRRLPPQTLPLLNSPARQSHL